MQRQIGGRETVAGQPIVAEPLEKVGMGLQDTGENGARHALDEPERDDLDGSRKERRKGLHAAGPRQGQMAKRMGGT